MRVQHCGIRRHNPQICIVPPEPVARACARPVWSVSSDQHEVVRVSPHEPHVECLVRCVRLMVESTHVVQSHVSNISPEIAASHILF